MSKTNRKTTSHIGFLRQLIPHKPGFNCIQREWRVLSSYGTFGEETLTWTMMGASEVLRSWAGWLMVSASSTTSCRERASSKIRSISLCTSADEHTHEVKPSPSSDSSHSDWTGDKQGNVEATYRGWSECWISQWWLSYWGCWEQSAWLKIYLLSHVW